MFKSTYTDPDSTIISSANASKKEVKRMNAGKHFFAGEKVSHQKFGVGFIRILKPFEKSFVEFINKKGEDEDNSRCVWVKNSELIEVN